VVENENKELVQTQLPTKIRVCIDYQKLNTITRKDHFSFPFIDQILEWLAGHEYYYFLDGYLSYNRIPIALEDQEKTTFTCPFEIFAYHCVPFGLYNVLAMFQDCILSLFSDMVEWFLEIIMDDFSIYGDSFDQCLHHLELILKHCAEKHLTLNWKKYHFMVKHEIVMGHEISRNGIKVVKAKIDIIAKLPIPKYVKDIWSFLGNVSFYQRFIKDFSKIARPLTNLLAKDVSFNFDNECLNFWEKLKKERIFASIISVSDWSKPFKIMCNASDFVIGIVLGQRIDNKQHAIHYSSRTLNDA